MLKLCLLLLGLDTTVQASTLPIPSFSARKQSTPLPKAERPQDLLVPWVQGRTAATASMDRFTPDGQGASLWLYQGSLTDPLTGKVLAIVEGFEVITLKGLWQNATTAVESSTGRIRQKHKSKIEHNVTSFLQRLPTENHVTNWTRTLLLGQQQPRFKRHSGSINGIADEESHERTTETTAMQAAAVWDSRKVFLYRSTDKENDLLTTIRLRPGGPQRNVPLSQAISTWDATTTVVQPDHPNSPDGDDDDNSSNRQAFFFGTVLRTSSPSSSPSSTFLWNTAPVTWDDTVAATSRRTRKPGLFQNRHRTDATTATRPVGNLEFTIHARPRQRRQQEEAITRHLTAQRHRSAGLAPPRAALVSLGGAGTSSGGAAAAAAHETYRYDLPGGRLSYSRYGEGPVWYGPHRTCRLELRAQHATDLEGLSPVVQELVRRLVTAPELDVVALFPEEVMARELTHPVVQRLQLYWQRFTRAMSVQAL